ncbi:MAG: hypothetical protein R3F39_16685 [Myxococcota bacterium]
MASRVLGRRWFGVVAAGLAIAVGVSAAGCGGEEDAGDAAGQGDGGGDAGPGDSAGDLGGDTDGGVVPVDPWVAPAEGNQWRAMWNYRGRQEGAGGNTGQNELWISDPLGLDKQSVTNLSGLKGLDPPLSCNYGCVVSPDLVWLGVVTGPPSTDGFTFAIGKFNADLEVSLFKGVTWKDKIDFKFAGTKLFYSERAACTGVTCQYDIYRVDLATNVNKRDLIATYPPEADLEQSNYQGHFKVSPDGTKLILLNTTIRSVKVHMWKEGFGLVPLDFICELGSEGNCSGTGSQYSDVDPVAISPDGRWAVFFTFSDRWQRARLYDLDNPKVATLTTLASVTSGEFIEHACDPGVLQDWQWQRVVGDPQFTADGSEVVFTVQTDCTIADTNICPTGPCKPSKARTNLMRVKLATLLEDRALTSADVFSVTKNPFGDVASNRRITSFSLSPDGATALFTATPATGQDGKPLSDSSSRHRNDRELYRVRLDGTNLQQLTNDLSWLAETARVAPLPPAGP